MKKLIVIRGYCGVGKSTVAKHISIKNNFFFLEYDNFLWDLNSYSKLDKDVFEITYKNYISVLKNCLKTGKDICLEGILVSRGKVDPFNLKNIIKIVKKAGYQIYLIQLVATEKEYIKRMKKRNHVVPKLERDSLIKRLDKDVLNNEIIIDTSMLTTKQVINRVMKLINS